MSGLQRKQHQQLAAMQMPVVWSKETP